MLDNLCISVEKKYKNQRICVAGLLSIYTKSYEKIHKGLNFPSRNTQRVYKIGKRSRFTYG